MSVLSAEEIGPGPPELPKWALTVERPFPGLRPFAFPDHPFFFGREDQTFAIYRLLDRSRFIAVVGASGGGKSSLVRAGLLPLLEKETRERGGRQWKWFELRPGDAPIDSLATALCGQAEAEPDEFTRAVFEAKRERVAYALNRSSFGLLDALGQLQLPKEQSIVLVVDQFEELFRFSAAEKITGRDPFDEMRRRDESAHFVQLLLEASRDSKVAVHVLITMRSDFIGDCIRYHGLPEAVSTSQFLVPALTRDQREDIIQCPVARANATIEPELVERLINDSNDEFDLPVLQHCLMRLWEAAGEPEQDPDAAPTGEESVSVSDRPGRRLKLAHYPKVGGIARALSKHAEEILAGLAGREIAVEQTFRALSEVDKNGRATRRALTLERLRDETGIPEDELREVIDRFRADDCSFLVPPSSSVALLELTNRIDVGHEALLRNWERISSEPKPGIESKRQLRREGWLWEEESDGRTYRALLALIDSAGTRTPTLPLDQVELRWEWWITRTRTQAWAERYGGDFGRVKQLFEDSMNALKADRLRQQADEANKRDRATQAARVERETLERQKAEAEANLLRTQARSTRIIVGLLAVLAMVTLVLAYFSYIQRNEAIGQRGIAEQKQKDADTQRGIAEAQRSDADRQRVIADLQRAEADLQRAEADRLRTAAETERAKADVQRAAALLSQSRILASQSRKETARGYTRFGFLLAQEAFEPLKRSGKPSSEWPQDAEMALHTAMPAILPNQLIARIPQQGERGIFGPGANLIAVTDDSENVVRIWNRQGKQVGEIRHLLPIVSVKFSQDGTQLVTAAWDQSVKIWKSFDNTTTVLQHENFLNFAAFSPDGKRIVSGAGRDVYIWSTSGTRLATLRQGSPLSHAAFSADSKRLITSDGSTGRVWTSEGKKLFDLPAPARDIGVSRAIFSPDGKFIFALSAGRTAHIWNRDGKNPRPISGHQELVTDATFNSDGSRLITVSRDQTAQIWDTDELQVVATLRHEGAILSAAFSKDEQQILTTSTDGTVRLWSANGNKLASLQLKADASAAAFDPNSRGIFTLAGDELRFWDPSKREAKMLIHPAGVSSAAFDRTKERVLTVAAGVARVWALKTNTYMPVGDGTVSTAIFLGDGSRVLVKARSGRLQLWNSEGKKLREFAGMEGPRGLEFLLQLSDRSGISASSEGRHFQLRSASLPRAIDYRSLLSGGSATVEVWDDQGKRLADTPRPVSARFNRDSTRIVTTTADDAILLWDISGERIGQPLSPGRPSDPARRERIKLLSPDADSAIGLSSKEDISEIRNVEFSPDGKTILASYSGGLVQLWTSDGARINEFRTDGKIASAFPSPDGTQVAIVRPGSGIEFWSVSGQRIASVDRSTDLLRTVAPQFSADGSKFLAASGDKTVTLWDTASKTLRILQHDASVLSASFSVAGDKILTASSDGSVRVWSAAAQKLAEINMDGRISSVSFNEDATQLLVTTRDDSVVRIFNLYSSEQVQKLAADLKLEPLTENERFRLLIFETATETKSTDSANP